MTTIHPSVKMAPGVLIGDQVTIEKGCEIGPYTIINGPTHIGQYNIFGPHTVIGADPQDKKFIGGGTCKIGHKNRFREFSTVHRGHLSKEGTVIGNNNDFLVNAHVAHDVRVGDGNFIANNTLLAGHVEVGNYINMSGLAGTHQFTRIGDYAMISGLSGIRGDVYPYSMIQGDPATLVGVNVIGLQRAGFSREEIAKIKEAFRWLRNPDVKQKTDENAFYDTMIEFAAKSQRGMIKTRKRVTS